METGEGPHSGVMPNFSYFTTEYQTQVCTSARQALY